MINGHGEALGQSESVSGTLTLTTGNITTGSSTLTLGTSTSMLGTLVRTSGTILGNFRRWFAGATVNNVLFPIGTAGNYRPSNISFTAAPSPGGTLTASFTASDPGSSGLPLSDGGTSIVKAGPNGFWTLAAGNGLTGGTYSLDLTADAFAGVSNFAALRILKRANSSSSWTLNGTHSVGTGSNATPVAHRTGMSGFSDFGIGGASDNPLPIQLISFTAVTIESGGVRIEWKTLSEVNNLGFEIQRKRDDQSAFVTLANSFIPGHGTTIQSNSYIFIDLTATPATWTYRLKQTDLDGTVHYPGTLSVAVVGGTPPTDFSLEQNYPNPFNPTTEIQFSIVSSQFTTLRVYDALGREVATLVNEWKVPGSYSVRFDGSKLASGMYLYHLQAGNFVQTRRLLLVR